MLTAEQIMAAHKANIETLFGLTQKAFEGVEKLVELNVQATKAALADTANMSKSSLHHHFKSLTAMSPLQYQKQIRLQEARKLMLLESIDAATVARRVGYESPSQFSREYRRLFGAPPLRDVARMR